MNSALIRKTVRDNAMIGGISLLAVVAFQILFVMVMSTMAPEAMEFLRRFEFFRGLFQSLFNIDVTANVSPTTLTAVGMAHPLMYVITWGVMIAICSRTTAGEIDRGTADLLLTLPLSRLSVFVSTSAPHLVLAALLSAAGWLGVMLGQEVNELPEPIDAIRLGWVATNLFLLLCAIGGVTTLASVALNRRSIAIGAVVSLLVVSFMISFLEPFLPIVKRFQFLGLLHYYRPVDVVRAGEIPWRQFSQLAGIAAASWTAGLIIHGRRDIPAP